MDEGISYLGHIILENGILHDPRKVSALKEIRPPSIKDELQTVLGMTNYLAEYIPNMSSLNQPIRDLAKQQQFNWEHQYDTAFTNIKEFVCSSLASLIQQQGTLSHKFLLRSLA